MATKHEEMQYMIRRYKEETGKKEIDMKDVARWALLNGWPAPKPVDPVDRFARDLSKAAREEIRNDAKTGRPYRANHAVITEVGGQQAIVWIDIDEAPRKPMHKSLIQRREQMIGDGLQLTLDADHWNSINPTENPIVIPMDFTDDVEWRKNAPDLNENLKVAG